MREALPKVLLLTLTITLMAVAFLQFGIVNAQGNGDLIVSGGDTVVINGTAYECMGKVIVKDNGTLVISCSTFTFNSSSPEIIVMDNGTLIIEDSTIDSVQAPYAITVNLSAHVSISSSKLLKCSSVHVKHNAMVVVSQSQLYVGANVTISESSHVEISNSMVSCPIVCCGEANITFNNIDKVSKVYFYDSVTGILKNLNLDELHLEGYVGINASHLTINSLSIEGGSLKINSSSIYVATLTIGNLTLEHSEVTNIKLLSSGCNVDIIRSTVSGGIYIPVFEFDHLTVKVCSGYVEEWHSIENIYGVGITPVIFIYCSSIESWVFEASDRAILEIVNSTGVKVYAHDSSKILVSNSHMVEAYLRESSKLLLHESSVSTLSAMGQSYLLMNKSKVLSETSISGEVNATIIESTTILGSNSTLNTLYHIKIYSSNVRLYRCNIKFLSVYNSTIKLVNSQVICLHNHMSSSTVNLVRSDITYECKCLRVTVVSYAGVKIRGAIVAVRYGNIFISNKTDENGCTLLEFIPANTPVTVTVATENFSERVQITISECSNVTIEVGPPKIIDIKISPERPTDKLNTTVIVRVYDPSGINYVKLMYKAANEPSWNTVFMRKINETAFEADIPPYPVNTVVKFYIIVEDACGQWTTSEEQIYVVSPSDLEPPTILKVYWEDVYENETIVLYCKVYDENGIMKVIFHYKIGNGPWFNVTGTIYRPNVYRAEIPGQKAETKIYVYVEVWDTYYNKAVSDTYTVIVKTRPLFTSISLMIPLAMVAAMVIVLIISMRIGKRRE